jgi:hypothetical protein
MRLDCRRLNCKTCRRKWERDTARHYADRFAGEGMAVHRLTVTPSAWRNTQARITRAGARFVRIPTAGDRFEVFTTAELGEVVPDVPTALASVLGDVPAERADRPGNVSCSRGWSLSAADTGESQWEFVGLVNVPVQRAVIAAEASGLKVIDYIDQPGLGEVLDLLAPRDPKDVRWHRFERLIGLHVPENPGAVRRHRVAS